MTAARLSLEEAVYAQLEDEILGGILPPGSVITEQMICERTGASRTPVREALRRLANEDLVAMQPNRSAVVMGVSPEDLADIYEIRRRLEGLASRRAALCATAEERAKLRETVELQDFYFHRADPDEHLRELDNTFHELVYEACGSRTLIAMLSRLHRKIGFYRQRSLHAPARTTASIAEHREILGAIERGDADAAEALTVTHIENAYQHVKKVLED